MLKLVIADDEGNTTTVPLARDEITIGRREGNTIRLTDRNVSRKHARLERGENSVVLHDLGSFTGTILNGERIAAPCTLRGGDQFSIGDYRLSIAAEIEPGAETPTPTLPEVSAPRLSVDDLVASWRIVFLGPKGVPGSASLDRLPLVMGRAETADIPLAFASISREHARLDTDGTSLTIEDLQSANGVTVNGERTAHAILSPGDLVSLGEVEFRIARRGDDTLVVQRPVAPSAPLPAPASRTGLYVGLALGALLAGGVAFAVRGPSTPPPAPPVVAVENVPAPVLPAPVAVAVPVAPVPIPAPVPVVVPPPVVVVPEPPAPPEPVVRAAHAAPAATTVHHASPVAVAPAPVRTVTPAPVPVPPAPAPTPAPVAPTSTGSAISEALACNADNACIIRALNGRARSEREVGFLAQTYRLAGQRAQAMRTMNQYLEQFPAGPRASAFRTYLADQ